MRVLLLAVTQVTNRLTVAWAYHSARCRYGGRGNSSFVFLDFSVHFSSSSLPPSFLTGTTWLLQRAVTTAKTAGQRKDRKPTEWPRWVGFVWAALEISLTCITNTVGSVKVLLVDFNSFGCALKKMCHDASRVVKYACEWGVVVHNSSFYEHCQFNVAYYTCEVNKDTSRHISRTYVCAARSEWDRLRAVSPPDRASPEYGFVLAPVTLAAR